MQLAHAGCDVTILERRDQAAGCEIVLQQRRRAQDYPLAIDRGLGADVRVVDDRAGPGFDFAHPGRFQPFFPGIVVFFMQQSVVTQIVRGPQRRWRGDSL